MSRWPLAVALSVALAAAAAPATAQQIQSQPSFQSAVQTSAPEAPTAQPAGPRVSSMERVEAKLNVPATVYWTQDNVDLRTNYLIYILVAAVLVVLLIFLIKRA